MRPDHFGAYGAQAGHQSRAEREAAFRRLIDETKDRHNISDVAALDRKVKRTKKPGEFVALCAFHNERTPSMRLNDLKGAYYCFGCGATGDVVRYVSLTRNLDFKGALRWLGATDLPEVDHAARARAAEEDAAQRAAAIAEAGDMWERCIPVAGTPADAYLRGRGITMPLPDSLRFGAVYAWRNDETGEVGPDLPALVGAVVDGAGELTGVQRIFVKPDGSGKAKMRKPKKSLGRVRGGALRLGPVAPELILCEGPEDGLSLAQEMPGRSVWVALGTAMMPEMQLPGEVRAIVIAGQNDEPGKVAVKNAAEALSARGMTVRTMFPDPRFKDWNDQLQGVEQ